MFIGITYNSPKDYSVQGFSEQDVLQIMMTETLQAIESSLTRLGHQTQLIGNFVALMKAIEAGAKWDLVFNIADGTRGTGREALIPAILDAYNIPYTFSNPLILTICTHKGMTKDIVRNKGIKTPPFVIVEKIEDLEKIDIPYPLFIKPLMGGRSLGVNENSLIEKPEALLKNCTYLLKSLQQPVLIETYLPGREFSVAMLGTSTKARSLGLIEIKLNEKADRYAFSRLNKAFSEDRVQYFFPEDEEAKLVSELALSAWKTLGCQDFGRIDIRSDVSHEPQFIEANPIPGLHPKDSVIAFILKNNNIPYTNWIEEIIKQKS